MLSVDWMSEEVRKPFWCVNPTQVYYSAIYFETFLAFLQNIRLKRYY